MVCEPIELHTGGGVGDEISEDGENFLVLWLVWDLAGWRSAGQGDLLRFFLDVARCTAMSQATRRSIAIGGDVGDPGRGIPSAAECRGRRQLDCSCWAGR